MLMMRFLYLVGKSSSGVKKRLGAVNGAFSASTTSRNNCFREFHRDHTRVCNDACFGSAKTDAGYEKVVNAMRSAFVHFRQQAHFTAMFGTVETQSESVSASVCDRQRNMDSLVDSRHQETGEAVDLTFRNCSEKGEAIRIVISAGTMIVGIV